jgi:hypothetical protein
VQARGVDESCASLHSPRPQEGSFHPASAAVLRSGTVVRVDVQLQGAAELCGVRRIQLDSLALVDSRGIKKAASLTPRYGSITQLSEVSERSTAMRQAGGADESCASGAQRRSMQPRQRNEKLLLHGHGTIEDRGPSPRSL